MGCTRRASTRPLAILNNFFLPAKLLLFIGKRVRVLMCRIRHIEREGEKRERERKRDLLGIFHNGILGSWAIHFSGEKVPITL
jgi:hypothetical protein